MQFNILIEMIQAVTRNKLKHIEVIGNPDNKNVMIESFYEAVSKGIISSDETAVKYLYGHTNKKDAAYLRLKNRLIRQVTTSAFFIDVNQPAFNDRAKAYFSCYRDFAAAFVLMLRGSPLAGIYTLEQVLEQSIKYEFTELIADITRHLRYQIVRSEGATKQLKKYVKLHREYEEKRRLEILAFDYREELVAYYAQYRSPNNEVYTLANCYFNELMPLAPTVNTSRYYFHTYEIGIIKYFAVNDCQSALLLIDEALTLLYSRPNTNRSMLQMLSIHHLSCLTQLKLFENDLGKKSIEYCLSLDPVDINWFRCMETYFYYCSYQCNYNELLDIFKKTVNNPRFNFLETISLDNWLLLGGYLHLLAACGKVDSDEVTRIVGPFRYTKLVNEIKNLDKDRKGMNIPVMLLPILFSFIQEKDRGNGRSKEALLKYRQRYLDNEINQRSSIFVNMLLALDKKADNPIDAEKKIRKGLEMLSQQQPQVIGQYFAIEIIPYEDLWAMLMEKIDKKGKKGSAY